MHVCLLIFHIMQLPLSVCTPVMRLSDNKKFVGYGALLESPYFDGESNLAVHIFYEMTPGTCLKFSNDIRAFENVRISSMSLPQKKKKSSYQWPQSSLRIYQTPQILSNASPYSLKINMTQLIHNAERMPHRHDVALICISNSTMDAATQGTLST